MLVTFSCETHENVTMFGNVAIRLLKIMGHSGTVPSAFSSEEVPEALARLEHAIEEERQKTGTNREAFDNAGELEVSLVHRALPLIALLKDAAKGKSYVMWK